MNKSFEDQWKDALGDASQAPPPEIWERVEAELDRKKSRFILWNIPLGRSNMRINPVMLSGVAAAVLLVLGTLFFVNLPVSEYPVSRKADPAGKPGEPGTEMQELSPAVILDIPPVITDNTPAISRTVKAPEVQSLALQVKEEETLPLTVSREKQERHPATVNASYSPLTPLPLRELQVYAPYPRLEIPVEYSRVTRKERKKTWMGLLAANAPFHPNFSAPGFQQQALSAVQSSDALLSLDNKGSHVGMGGNFYSNSSRTDAQSIFKSGQSMTFGLSFGRRLKKRLSLESGVKFTRATATHNSNVYAVNKITGETESFSHANYLSSSNKMSDVLISVNGTSRYSYNFLSVPLLLNYELLQVGKLDVNAVGGLSTEFLISGTVVNSKQQEHSFTSGNSNFRPVSIAGAGGIRLSYPVTAVLDINLGGMYQHFITSGLQKGSDATFRPSMLGINLGLSVRQ